MLSELDLSLLPVLSNTLMPYFKSGLSCIVSGKSSRLTSVTRPGISSHLPIYGSTKLCAWASLYCSKKPSSFSGSMSKNSRPLGVKAVTGEGEAFASDTGMAGVGEGEPAVFVATTLCCLGFMKINQRAAHAAKMTNSVVHKSRIAFRRFTFCPLFSAGYVVRKTANGNALRATNKQSMANDL